MSRSISHLVIHCADTPNGRHIPVEDVDVWHQQRNFQRMLIWRKRFNTTLKAVGYHYLIDVDGKIQTGRHPDEIGAHVAGYNAHSIGIMLAGRDVFSDAQWKSLISLLAELHAIYPEAVVCGHRDFPNVAKSCPNFDVQSKKELTPWKGDQS